MTYYLANRSFNEPICALLTDPLADFDHGRRFLDDLLELVHDVLVGVVDPRPRYDDASKLVNDAVVDGERTLLPRLLASCAEVNVRSYFGLRGCYCLTCGGGAALVEGERVVADGEGCCGGGGGRVGVEPLQQKLEDCPRVVHLAVRALQRHRDVAQRQNGVPETQSQININPISTLE